MKYGSSLTIAILLTSLAYFLGDYFLSHSLVIWQSLIIGASVVLLGALVEKLHAPMWLIIVTPFPVGMSLLYFFLNTSFDTWLYTYITTLIIYIIIHVFVSFCFNFHSLIPAWKLSVKRS